MPAASDACSAAKAARRDAQAGFAPVESRVLPVPMESLPEAWDVCWLLGCITNSPARVRLTVPPGVWSGVQAQLMFVAP